MNALQAANAEIVRLKAQLKEEEESWNWVIKVNKRWQRKFNKVCTAMRKIKISIDKSLQEGK